MAELADAIVATARATLEATIEHINTHPTWRARVVYGDTDSVFVHLPGRTREQAFAVGSEMAVAVTARNPAPVKLKFEKVSCSYSSSLFPILVTFLIQIVLLSGRLPGDHACMLVIVPPCQQGEPFEPAACLNHSCCAFDCLFVRVLC